MNSIKLINNWALRTAICLSLATMALVPLGRPLERMLDPASSKAWIMPILIGASLIFSFYYYLYLLRHWNYLQRGLHFIAVVSGLALFVSFEPHFVEYNHLLFYGGISICLVFCVESNDRVLEVGAILLYGVALALFDEFLQWIHPDRVFDLRDLAFNSTASVIGLLLGSPFIVRATPTLARLSRQR